MPEADAELSLDLRFDACPCSRPASIMSAVTFTIPRDFGYVIAMGSVAPVSRSTAKEAPKAEIRNSSASMFGRLYALLLLASAQTD